MQRAAHGNPLPAATDIRVSTNGAKLDISPLFPKSGATPCVTGLFARIGEDMDWPVAGAVGLSAGRTTHRDHEVLAAHSLCLLEKIFFRVLLRILV
jgi:hypothetical protein